MAQRATEIRTDYLRKRRDALQFLRSPRVRLWGKKALQLKPMRMIAGRVPWHRAIPFPPHVRIELTNRCNLQCTMCVRFHADVRDLGTMDFDLYEQIIDQLVDAPACDILLTGFGEPLLHPQFERFLEHASNRGLKTLRIITAGSLLTPEKVDAILDSGISNIHFSIDGNSPETYNKIRIGADFDQTLANVTHLLSERERRGLDRPQVVLRTIVMPETAHEIDDLQKRWNALLRDSDEIWTQELLAPSVENRTSQDDDAQRAHAHFRHTNAYFSPCSILWKMVSVRWNGDYEFCCAVGGTSDLGLNLNFSEFSLREAWQHPGLARIRSKHASGNRPEASESCRNCKNFSFNAL